MAVREQRIAQAEAAAQREREEESAELAAASRARIGWTVFIVSMILLFGTVTLVTISLIS